MSRPKSPLSSEHLQKKPGQKRCTPRPHMSKPADRTNIVGLALAGGICAVKQRHDFFLAGLRCVNVIEEFLQKIRAGW